MVWSGQAAPPEPQCNPAAIAASPRLSSSYSSLAAAPPGRLPALEDAHICTVETLALRLDRGEHGLAHFGLGHANRGDFLAGVSRWLLAEGLHLVHVRLGDQRVPRQRLGHLLSLSPYAGFVDYSFTCHGKSPAAVRLHLCRALTQQITIYFVATTA